MTKYREGTSFHAVGVCLLLIATLVASSATSHRRGAPLAAELETIPFEISGFSGTPNPELLESVVKELNATSYISRRYTKGGLDADLFVAYYARQRAGESMHSPKHCLPGAGWEIWNYDTIQLPAGGSSFTVNRYSISHAGDRRVVFYWYQSRERVFASEYMGKLLLARDALFGKSTAAAMVRVIVPDEPRAMAAAAAISAEMIVQMQRCFRRL
jgi:EpsI family protein